jgi:hypothetical protein
MLGWLLFAAAGLGAGYLWKREVAAQKSGSPWKAAFPRLPNEDKANALELLDFKPFTLMTGKHTYGLYLAPSGIPEAVAKAVLQTPSVAYGPVQAVMIYRSNIPIPGPMTVPVYADLWMVESIYAGPPKTVTPAGVAAAALAPSTTTILLDEHGVPIAQVAVPTTVPSAVPSTAPASSVANPEVAAPLASPPVTVSGDGTVTAIPPNKQLGSILYQAAMSPVLMQRTVFIPVGASQR